MFQAAPLGGDRQRGRFAIGAVAIELGERQNLFVCIKGGDEHAVFLDFALCPDFDEAERQLAAIPCSGHALL